MPMLGFCRYHNMKETYISTPSKIWNIQIGDFATQIENDPGEVISGSKDEGDQRKILRLVVSSDFSWMFWEILKIKVNFLW